MWSRGHHGGLPSRLHSSERRSQLSAHDFAANLDIILIVRRRYSLSEVEQIVVDAGASTDVADDEQEQVEDEPDAAAEDDDLESD